MKLRKLRLIAVPVAAAIMLMGSVSPAEAAASGSGVVSGNVTTSGGVPLDPTGPQTSGTVTFASTAIAGEIQVDSCAFAGVINVSASATATDTAVEGSGTVTSLTGSGSTADLVSINVSLAAPQVIAGVVAENTFRRLTVLVTVTLGLTVTISTPLGSCTARVTALVHAVFAPTTTNGTHATGAAFTGSFSLVGTP